MAHYLLVPDVYPLHLTSLLAVFLASTSLKTFKDNNSRLLFCSRRFVSCFVDPSAGGSF